jgi:CHAT domain-containing protein
MLLPGAQTQVSPTMISCWSVLAMVLGAEALSADGVQTARPRVATRKSLPLGQVVEEILAPDETPSYPLRLEAGAFVRARATYRDVAVELQLIGPDQKLLLQAHQPYLFWIADTAGEYRIEVIGTPGRRVPLRYAIALQEIRAAEPSDQKRLAAQRVNDQVPNQAQSEDARREAIRILEAELALWHEAGEKSQEAEMLLNIEELEYQLGDTKQARAHCDEARAIAQQAGDRYYEAIAIANKGRLLSSLGRTQEAIENKREALEILRALGDRLNEHALIGNLAIDYRVLGEFERAVEFGEKALQYNREVGRPMFETFALGTLSRIFEEMGRTPEALKSAQSAVQISRREGLQSLEAYALARVGSIQSNIGRMPEAIDNYQQSLALWQKVGNRLQQTNTRAKLASAYVASGEVARGQELLERALLEFRTAGDRGGQLEVLYELALAKRALGNLGEARKHIDAAIDLQEATRRELIRDDWRSSFLATQRRSYELAVDMRMAEHRTAAGKKLDLEALSVSERARARTLVELLDRGGVDLEQDADPELIERRRQIEADLRSQAERQLRLITGEHSPAELAAAEAEAERLTEQLRDVQAKIRASVGNEPWKDPPTLGGAEIGPRLLDAETTLLEYWFGLEHSYVWLVTSSAVESYQLPPASEVEKTGRRAYEELKSPRGGSGAIRALARMLLHPLAKQLQGNRLVIVADGVLQYLPFGALPLPNGAPVISRFVVANLPSASALAVVRRDREGRSQPTKLAAVLADPVYTKDDPRVTHARTAAPPRAELVRSVKESGLVELNRLPATRVEAAILRKLARDQELLEAVGFEANRDTVLGGALGDYRIVHFATHGLVNSFHPELSGLVLSLVDREGKPRDGFLQAHEIYALKLGADLVVLSACRTALGKEIRGEGLMSLMRAFMAAGVPRVVASLWSVPDAATAELMKRFYRGVMTNGLAPAAALHDAQDSLRKDKRWSAPYFWAGFTLHGDWN